MDATKPIVTLSWVNFYENAVAYGVPEQPLWWDIFYHVRSDSWIAAVSFENFIVKEEFSCKVEARLFAKNLYETYKAE